MEQCCEEESCDRGECCLVGLGISDTGALLHICHVNIVNPMVDCSFHTSAGLP